MARSGTLRVAATWSDARLRRGMKKTGGRMERWAAKTAAQTNNRFVKGFAGLAGGVGFAAPHLAKAAKPLVAAFLAIGAKSFNAFKKFDTGMRRIWTVLPGVQKASIDRMGDDIEAYSKRTGIAMGDVQRATYQAISDGTVQLDRMGKFWETAGKVSYAGSLEMEAAANVLTGTNKAFEKSELSFSQIGDKLAAGSIRGKIVITELAQAVATSGPIFASVGGTLDEFIAYMVRLTATGLPAQEAATQIKSIAGELLRENSVLNKSLKELFGGTFPQLRREGWSVHDMMERLNAEYDKGIVSTSELATRKEALSAFMVLFNDDVGETRQLISDLTKAEGDLEAQSKKMADGVQADSDRMRESIHAAFLEIGPDVADFVETVGPDMVSTFSAATTVMSTGVDVLHKYGRGLEVVANIMSKGHYETAIEKQKRFNEEFRKLSIMDSRIMYENAAQAASMLGMTTGDFLKQHSGEFRGDLIAPFTIANKIIADRKAAADREDWLAREEAERHAAATDTGINVLDDLMSENLLPDRTGRHPEPLENPVDALRWSQSGRYPGSGSGGTDLDLTKFISPEALEALAPPGADVRIVVELDGAQLADKWVTAEDLDDTVRVVTTKTGG